MALTVPIVADTSGLVRGLNTAGGRLRKFGKIAAIAAGAAAVGGLVKTLEVGTQKFIAQEKAVAQTNARLKSTGGVAKVTAKEIVALSDAIADKTGVDDDQIHAVENMLLTFTKIRNEVGANNDIFNQATQTVVDLSIAFEKDLNSSAIMLGKALNDPVKGITALSRAGVQFTEGQKKTIKALVDSGKFLQAQKMILKELETQVGGSGEAFGQTLPGQLSRAKQSFEVVAQSLAATFLPSIANAAKRVTDFLSLFAKAPTLMAKIKLVVGSIGNITWRGISSLYEWWTQQGRVELPARVVLTPSGKMQFDQFFNDIEARAYIRAKAAGRAFAKFFLDLFSSEGRKRSGDAIRSIGENIGEVGKFIFRISGTTLLAELISGFTTGAVELFAQALRDLVTGGLSKALPSFTDLGDKARGAVLKGFGRKGSTSLRNVLTQTVRDAVQSARETLGSLGAGLGGTLATLLGATFARPGGMKPADILAEERKLQDERLALEEKQLVAAANAAEATEEDKLALREFYLNKEKVLRDRALEDEIASRQRGIDDLVESFNKGLINADTFASQLRGIIGPDLGSELGIGFAGAFGRELETIIATAREIAGIAGAPTIQAGAAGGITSALKGENDRRFREALDSWDKRRKQRRKQAEDFRKRAQSEEGSKITDAEAREIRELMAKWDRENPKPKRADYGLALGGILKKQVFTAAEAGKEAIIPLDSGRGARMLRDALGTGGGSTQVINLTVNAGLGTNPDELSQVIVNSIKRYEKRNGSVFQGPLVSVAANAAGVTSTDSGATTFNRVRSLRSG